MRKQTPYVVYAFAVPFVMATVNFSFGIQNLIYTKICHNHYHKYELCSNSTFTKSHPEIQEEAGTWLNYVTLVQMVPSITVVILLSSYTDKVGHKFPIVLSVLAAFLALCWCALVSAKEFVTWPMFTVLLGPLLFGFGGAQVVMLMSSVGYIALITADGRREFYLSLFYAVLQGGKLISVITQGLIVDHFGQLTFFVISAALQLIVFLIVMCIMIDLKKPGYKTARLRDIFSCDNYKQAFICVFRKREGYGRSLLQLSVACFMIASFPTATEFSVEYLYFAKDIGMTLTYYSVFQGAMGILRVIMPLTILPFCQKVLKLEDRTIAILTVACIAMGYIFFAQGKLWLLWVGIVIGGPNAIFFGLIQNFNVQMVLKEEVGKMLSYVHLMQLIVEYVAALVSKTIYINTITVWAGAIFIVLGCFDLVVMALILIMDRLSIKHELALGVQMN